MQSWDLGKAIFQKTYFLENQNQYDQNYYAIVRKLFITPNIFSNGVSDLFSCFS